VSFPHLALIFLVALIVLGPQKMPKLVAQVGRWAGKARAMARQFREQLENEINLDELNKTAESAKTPPPDQFHPPYGHEAAATTDAPVANAEPPAEPTPTDAAAAPAVDTAPEATHPAVAQTADTAPVTPEAAAEPVVAAWVPEVHDGTQFEPAAPETISPTPMVGNHERV
jgi:sec-independent protein translocase protein TatB